MNKFYKAMLKTAACVLDQYSTQVNRGAERVSGLVDEASDRASELVDRGKAMIQPPDHTLRNAVSFAAGVGVGIGAAILFAPTSGADVRNSIREKVQNIRGRAAV